MPRAFWTSLMAASLVACTSWHSKTVPAPGARDSVPLGRQVRVRTTGGASYELTNAAVVRDSVVGSVAGTSGPLRVSVPLDEVRDVAERRTSVGRTSGLVLGVGGIVFLLAIAAAVAAALGSWS